jgi:hypothetical protein
MKKYSLIILCSVVCYGPYLFGMEGGSSHESSTQELPTFKELVIEDLLRDLTKLQELCGEVKDELDGQNAVLSSLEAKVAAAHISSSKAAAVLQDVAARARMQKYEDEKKYWTDKLNHSVDDERKGSFGENCWSGAEQLLWDDCWYHLGNLIRRSTVLRDDMKPAIAQIKQELQKLACQAGLDNFDANELLGSFFVVEDEVVEDEKE